MKLSNYHTLLLLFFCFATSLLLAQDINSKEFKDLSIRNIGPAGMSGRVTTIDAINSKPSTIYIGSASGGVWVSKNRGTTWKPIFEHEETMSIGALKINQSNPDEIWVGTGEGNPRNSHNSGKGIYKSIDAGETWTLMGLEKTKIIHRIAIDQTDPDIVYVAAMGSAWGPSKDRGVYKTLDGGKTWSQILYVNDKTGAADLIVDPENHNKLYVAMWQHQRTPWGFDSGGEGSGLYVTHDGGANWKQLGEDEGIPTDTLGRIGLAAATNKPDVLYALIETKNKQAIYRSDDAGLNWKMQSDKNVGNRPFYYSEIYVDPSNENRIFNLWSYVSKSEDGGKTFKTIMDYGNNVHPDHHAFWIDKNNPNYMIDGNDGGLNISEDGGSNWRFVDNLPIGQFYHINIDDQFPYQVYGGMQDNGSWVGPTAVLKRGGIRNSDFREVYFGDGFDIAPLPHDNNKGYAMSQGGNVSLYNKETGRNIFIKPVRPDTTELRFSWNAAMALDPFNDCGVYFGSQFLHFSNDCGQSWETISPDLTTNDPAKQDQSKSGGLTLDVTGAENHTTLLAISPSPLDESVIWTGSDDGRLHITTDRGGNWRSQESSLPKAPKHAFIPQIEVSMHDRGEAFVVVNNYRQNDWKPYLYHTTNLGKTWKSIASPEVMKSFVCSIVQDHIDPNLLFAGLDDGLYLSYNKGDTWTKIEHFPSVQIRDMKIHQGEDDLVIGTFGRSLWVIDDLNVIRDNGSRKPNISKTITSYPIDNAYQTTRRSVDGHRFIAQGMFVGDNISKAARIKYWINPDSISSKSKDKIKVRIFNSVGDTIRTFQHTPSKGLNTTIWNLRQDGVRNPSWNTPKEDEALPSGSPVPVGTYKVGLYFKEDSTYQVVQVLDDPRHTPTDESNLKSKEKFESLLATATKGFDQLKGYQDDLEISKSYVQNQPDSIKTQIEEQIKSLKSQIDSLQNLYMHPKDVRGYLSSKGMLNELLWPTSNYLRSYWTPSGLNAQRQLVIFEERVTLIKSAINTFKVNKMAPFKEDILNLPPVLFDDQKR